MEIRKYHQQTRASKNKTSTWLTKVSDWGPKNYQSLVVWYQHLSNSTQIVRRQWQSCLQKILFLKILVWSDDIKIYSSPFSECHFHQNEVWGTCLILCLLHLHLLWQTPLPSPRGRWAEWQTQQKSTGSDSCQAGRAQRSPPGDETGWTPQSELSCDLSWGTWA